MTGIVHMRIATIVLGTLLSVIAPAKAQELEPRAYRAIPVGMNFVVTSYTLSSGNVVVDATAPVADLDLQLNTAVVAYLRSFGLLGRSASVTVAAPYVFGSGSGEVNGAPTKGSRNAWADARVKMAVILVGGPALRPAEYAKRPQGRTFGVGLSLGLRNRSLQ